jgi:propionyl-CoA carboxylase beta chain
MGPRQAVDIINRRAIAAADDPAAARERLAERYAEEHVSAEAAAREGVVDEIIAPSATRGRLAGALRGLAGARQPPRAARNIQL